MAAVDTTGMKLSNPKQAMIVKNKRLEVRHASRKDQKAVRRYDANRIRKVDDVSVFI